MMVPLGMMRLPLKLIRWNWCRFLNFGQLGCDKAFCSQREGSASLDIQLDHHDDLPDPELLADDDQYRHRGSNLLNRCLMVWKESEADVGSLSAMLPSCGYLLLQVLEITLEEEKPTGDIVLHDREYYVEAKVDSRYLPEMMKRRWGRYSILQVKGTSGLHNELFIVSLIIFINFAAFSPYFPPEQVQCPSIYPAQSKAIIGDPSCRYRKKSGYRHTLPQWPMFRCTIVRSFQRANPAMLKKIIYVVSVIHRV